MDATQAKNLVGDLLQAGAVVQITADGVGGWTVVASPPSGSTATAAQANGLAVKWAVTTAVQQVTYR